LVADKRALTPTEAGELVVPRYDQLKDILVKIKARLIQSLYTKIKTSRTTLLRVEHSFPFKKPFDRIHRVQQILDEKMQRLNLLCSHIVRLEKERLTGFANRLESVSPLKVLKRGYSITTALHDDIPIKSSKELSFGTKVKTRLSEGSFISSVIEIAE